MSSSKVTPLMSMSIISNSHSFANLVTIIQ
jgi:hypothetical protein